MVQCAHVVQPVGELDQQHAHVVGEGEQQLAEILRLLGFLGDQIELFQLGQALHQDADIRAEQIVDLRASGGGVLDGVVQQRGCDGGVVELEIGEDGRDFERMGEIRISGRPLLLAMRLHRIDISAVEQALVGIRVIAAHPFDKVVLPHHRRLAGFRFLFRRLRRDADSAIERRAGARLILHSRQLWLRSLHGRSAELLPGQAKAGRRNAMVSRRFAKPERLEPARLRNQRPGFWPGLVVSSCGRIGSFIPLPQAAPRAGSGPRAP